MKSTYDIFIALLIKVKKKSSSIEIIHDSCALPFITYQINNIGR